MSDNSFRAITTRYKGYSFRSRLEARFAIYFDHLNIQWDYEAEGFELGNGLRYLPDFWLPEWDMWVEVKPSPPDTVTLEKARRLVGHSEKPLFISCGLPERNGTLVYPDNNYWAQEVPAFPYFASENRCVVAFPDVPSKYVEHRCKRFDLFEVEPEGRPDFAPAAMTSKAIEALHAARSARFEFGAKGVM